MTRLKAKEDLNVLNDKKGERVERMDEWMNEKCRGGGVVPIYRFIGDFRRDVSLKY